ncbi:FAD binding domain-containing protein, partial [Fusarium pseudocircinatum]
MLKVIIVGAGLAGLSAAISLRRGGHIVHIYEKSSTNLEIGAAINVPPNATKFLTRWGLVPSSCHFTKSRRVTYHDPFTMDTTAVHSTDSTARDIGDSELYYAHRSDLHSALKRLATRPDGPGVPVMISLNSHVKGYNPSKPSITLANSDEIHADLVIGADGIHSLASRVVTGRANPPIPSNHSNHCFRFLISADTLEQDPETRFWNQDCDGWTRLFSHDETRRRLVTYPCREFSDFDPRLLKIISKATDVRCWPLLYRHPISTWTREYLTLVGDAAHPMLPHQGQGAAQGMEDGVALGIVLYGATKNDIQERLKTYTDIRYTRACVIQILSSVGQDQSHLVHDELLNYIKKEEMP